MYRKVYLVVAALFLFGFANPNVLEFKAQISQQNAGEINLQWRINNESQVQIYMIERKMVKDAGFVEMTRINSRQSEGNSFYEWTDRNVFKSSAEAEPVAYNLIAIDASGGRSLLAQTEVNYTSTAVRRTWGSIKAMFQ